MIITLTGKDPQAPKNLIRYNGIKREFVTIKLAEKMIDHLNIESSILHKNTEEAKRQLEAEVLGKPINSLLVTNSGFWVKQGGIKGNDMIYARSLDSKTMQFKDSGEAQALI